MRSETPSAVGFCDDKLVPWFRGEVQSAATKGKLPPIGTLCQRLHLGGSRYRRWPEQLPARALAQQKMPWDGAPPLGKRRPGRPPATWLCCWCRGEVCRGPPVGLHSAALGCAGGLQGDPVAIVSEPQWLVVGPVTPALHLPHHRINVAPS